MAKINRELLILSATELLDAVNANEEMLQYLFSAPFTIKNIDIVIHNSDQNGRDLLDPEIATAKISNGILTYYTKNLRDYCKYKNEFKETYNEAVEILRNQSSVSDIPSEAQQAINRILYTTASEIKKKYHLQLSCSGIAMSGGYLEELFLRFDTKKPCSQKELRDLLIKCANEFVAHVNNPHFTLDNVHIMIYNYDKMKREVYDPGIATAELSRGILTYQTVDSHCSFKIKNTMQETYELDFVH